MLSSKAFGELSQCGMKIQNDEYFTFTNPTSQDSLTLDFEYFTPPQYQNFPPKFSFQLENPKDERPFSFFRKFLHKVDNIYRFKYLYNQDLDFYKITTNAFYQLIRDSKEYGCYADKMNFFILRPKYHIDVAKLKFGNSQSNWVTDKIQLDIFVRSLFLVKVFKSTFSLIELKYKPQILNFFRNNQINNVPVLYSLCKSIILLNQLKLKV